MANLYEVSLGEKYGSAKIFLTQICPGYNYVIPSYMKGTDCLFWMAIYLILSLLNPCPVIKHGYGLNLDIKHDYFILWLQTGRFLVTYWSLALPFLSVVYLQRFHWCWISWMYGWEATYCDIYYGKPSMANWDSCQPSVSCSLSSKSWSKKSYFGDSLVETEGPRTCLSEQHHI